MENHEIETDIFIGEKIAIKKEEWDEPCRVKDTFLSQIKLPKTKAAGRIAQLP